RRPGTCARVHLDLSETFPFLSRQNCRSALGGANLRRLRALRDATRHDLGFDRPDRRSRGDGQPAVSTRGPALLCLVWCIEFDTLAIRQPRADLSERDSRTLGCDPRINDERVECPPPQVVGLPPDDLVEESRIDATVDHGGSAQRVLAVLMLGFC